MDDYADLLPGEGSYPFQFSWDDFNATLYKTLVIASIASLKYIQDTVLPGITAVDPTTLAALPLLTSVVHGLLAFFSDTRPKAERARMSFREYRRLRAMRSAA